MAGILPSGIGGCCSGTCTTTSINVLIAEAVQAAGMGGSLCSTGHPEGVVTGAYCGQICTDTLTASLYTFLGTPGTKIGWNP